MTDINEIIGRAAVVGNISYTAEEIGAAVVKALGEAGYVVAAGWRTIDSAPTDGSRVLCWREGWQPSFLIWKTNHRIADARERHRPEQAEFYATHSDRYFGDPDEMDDYDLALTGKGPTHWFPLNLPA